MQPNNPQFNRLVGDTPASEKKMAEGFSALDKLMNDKKNMTATKKKAIDAAYKKVSDGRGGR